MNANAIEGVMMVITWVRSGLEYARIPYDTVEECIDKAYVFMSVEMPGAFVFEYECTFSIVTGVLI